MFLPQLAERDTYDMAGQQTDDINSLIEFINQVVLGNKDDSPEDEDDDSEEHFLVIKSVDLYCEQSITALQVFHFLIPAQKFPTYCHSIILEAAYDILSPPPKA
jgi:hypothetical protein